MLKEFESEREEHLGRINLAKGRAELLKDDVRPIHSTSRWAGMTGGSFDAAEISYAITF